MFRALSDCNRWGSRHGRDTRQAHGVSNHIHTPSALCRIHPAPISRRGESAASQLELLCVCVCRVHALSLSLSSMLSAQNSTAQLRALVGSHCDTVVASQVTCQARCTELLKSITSNGDLFFSTTYDLTSTTQQQALMVCMFGLFGCACVYVAFRLPSCIETHTHTLSLTHTLSFAAVRTHSAHHPRAHVSQFQSAGTPRISLDEAADPRFYWNRMLHKSLISKPEVVVVLCWDTHTHTHTYIHTLTL